MTNLEQRRNQHTVQGAFSPNRSRFHVRTAACSIAHADLTYHHNPLKFKRIFFLKKNKSNHKKCAQSTYSISTNFCIAIDCGAVYEFPHQAFQSLLLSKSFSKTSSNFGKKSKPVNCSILSTGTTNSYKALSLSWWGTKNAIIFASVFLNKIL